MLTLGLMSGTSMDGVDGVLARFEPGRSLQILGHAHRPMPAGLRAELMALNQRGDDELHRAALAANALARLQADTVAAVLEASSTPPEAVQAIGSHGQTVRHRPGEFDDVGYTVQLNQPALLAELTGIAVICDFRSRDVAAGGQGAPLVPAFHQQVFGTTAAPRAVLNLGGIGNLTLLPAQAGPAQALRGFDCGPGNALLDHWVALHRDQAFDADGLWAAGGTPHAGLLAKLLEEPFLQKDPPKSTGRDLFNPAWLARQLAAFGDLPPQDVQATLAAFTARSAARALLSQAPQTAELLVCGGGALNGDLMRRLAAELPGVPVLSSAERGLPPLQVEAAAFAWLAWAFLNGLPGNRPAVTGARAARVLGALYPAH